MKDNSLDGHRGKVAVSDTSRVTTAGSSVKCDLKTSVTTAASDGAATTNFDDDYNEWELGIGDLIIDLDADIEKTNTNHHHHHHQNGTVVGNSPGASTAVSPSSVGAASFAFLGSQSCTPAMSNSKSSRLISGTNNSGSAGSTTGGTSVSANSTGGTAGAIEHQATVDKGLKMKIKRKTVGNKYSEAKHEIVQSDTKSVPAHPLCENMASGNAASGQNSVPSSETKSKHSSSKGRTSSHRDKKEKNRDKDKSANTKAVNSAEVNGAMNVMSPSLKITNSGVSMSSLTPSSGASTITQNGSIVPSLPQTSTSCRSVPTSSCNSNCSSSSSSTSTNSVTSSATAIQEPAQMSCPAPPACSPPMPNLTLKLENKFTTGQPSVVVKQEDRLSPPLKKMRTDDSDKVDTACSPVPPEMKDTSTCTSVGTITEPDCLGPCEPGTSVMLEGIVWQETEGGVLVVNVTWRGKTYVGTLLDCTKHDWAPPRFCESPTSDVDSKTSKGRGKRGRGSNNNAADVNTYNEARNCVQSKLRNGKGRRTTVNSSNSNSGFTVPSSPAKSDNGVPTNNKRKGRPAEVEVSTPQTDSKSSKRSRSQSRGTPTSSSSSISAAEFSQPSSPVLIECPEPNCSKKYKHINGLRYHQTHAHSGLDGSKLEDSNSEDVKDATNSSDNEESIQESMSVPPSPAMSFRNSASPRPTSGRTLQGENTSSLSCSSLPESDPYSLTPDLSTLASVAISDSKAAQKSENVSKATPPPPHPATTPELTPVVSSEAVKTPSILPAMTFSASQCPSSPVSVPPAISTESNSVSVPVPAVTTTSVIHSPATMDVSVVSPSVTVSIPTSHVVLSQGITIGGNSVTTTTHTTSTVVCHNPVNVVSRSNLAPTTTTTTSFVSVPSLPVTSTTTLCSSPVASVSDKSKIKQEKLEKYKPKSPLATAPAIRPIVPAPSPQLITLSANIPVSHPNISPGSHNLVTSSLKPIQPKPTILGEPPTISPALESLKKEKSKHKKKSKDKDKEKEKKTSVQMPPSSVRHVSSHGGEECEAMDITPYPNLEAVPGSRDSLNAAVSLPPASHTSMSPLPNQPKPSDSALDMNVADDNMNENIQSPAYSDISDANDTAPVLESEVPSGKEKEDKVGKSTPDTPQSPAANISAYGMYPYYSQPPYLLPSVSPQNSVPAPQMASVTDKPESSKKLEQDRIKENRPWSNSSGEIPRERQSATEHDSSEKKSMRGEENAPSSSVIPSPSSSAAIQDYPMQQHYPYSYGYVQNYQYSVEPSYMQLLETDPHYKQQYKQYIEEQQRLYKEQQHHHQQQQHHHHHQQQQQQHSHHSHSQHHSSHQSKNPHHSSSSSSSVKEERGREKERSMPEKLSNSGMVMDHSGKQHSSLSLVVNKEHDAPRDPDTRPPSLPAQARVDSSTPSSASAAAALKEKQNENHQILKENIELKSQMDASKNKVNQYEMAMLYERHRDDMRRYYIYQQQHKVESEQQQQQQQQHHHMSPHPSSLSSSLKSHKDEVVALSSSQSKPNHFTESSRSSVISPPKSDHIKCSTSQPNSTSSPKTSVREPPVNIPKEYSSSSGITGSSSKKESSSSSKAPVERLDGSVREEKNKSDKSKVEVKVEPEGQKPTMETTGPPPPPTNSYAYLHPSYLPPAPPHFPHMPFEAAHAVYRGGINPMLMSSPHYSSSPYVHQLRYPTPGACDLPAPSQPVDPLGNKLHAPGPGKALDLLHQVSQHYTTHKIHELQEHALMSPTPTSTPSTTPSTSSNTANKVSSTEPVMTVAKVESGSTRDSSRSPPTQRHLHTHHHTHVGVGYPIYDPYGVAQQHWKQSQNQRRVPYRYTR